MSHDGSSLCMQWIHNGTELWGWQGRELEMASLPAKESRSDLHMEAAWGEEALKLQSWLNANLTEIAKNGEKGQGGK